MTAPVIGKCRSWAEQIFPEPYESSVNFSQKKDRDFPGQIIEKLEKSKIFQKIRNSSDLKKVCATGHFRSESASKGQFSSNRGRKGLDGSSSADPSDCDGFSQN